MNSAHLLLTAQLIAYWPVWRWYVSRLADTSDEPWGLLALGTALLFLLLHGTSRPLRLWHWGLASGFALTYTLADPLLPPLLRAVIAVIALGCTLSGYCLERSFHLGIVGLLLLSLPLLASLQFYAGYPVRWLTTQIAAELIQLTGYTVTAQGTTLLWLGELIAVDAPCAGIRMLWTGLYLNFTLACFTRLSLRGTWLAYSLSTGCIFLGNVLRATALFYVEAGLTPAYDGLHSGIGLVIFAAVATAIIRINRSIGRTLQCA